MYTMGPGFQSTLTALDPATGATLDSATLGGLVFPNMVVADDLVVAYLTDDVSTSENTLVVRSRSTLDVLWSGHPGPVETPVLFGSGRLYTQTSDGSGAFVRAYATQGCGGRPCATRCSPCPCRRRPSPTTASRRGCSPPPTTATSSCSGP
jgi:hypothetical protein